MYLADIIGSLANGDPDLSSKFVQAKALWTRMVSDVDFTDELQLKQLAFDIGAMQPRFEDIGGSSDLGKALMGLTCYLPFYDEADGIHEKREEAIALFEAIQASSVSEEVIAQAEASAGYFYLELED